MDADLIKAFIAIAECQSFTQAAQRLHLTQSAISKRIAQFESALGYRVFDRLGKRIMLTEAGTTLLPTTKETLATIEHALGALTDCTQGVSGRLRVATSHHIGVHRLPPLLKRYMSAHPNVQLDLHFLDSDQATLAIKRGEFDLAFITCNNTTNSPDTHTMEFHPIWDDPLQFVCGLSHPLANYKRPSLKHLEHYPALLPHAKTYTSHLVNQLFAQHQCALQVMTTTNHLDAIRALVGIGMGWSVLPTHLSSDQMVRLPLSRYSLNRQLGCIHLKARTLSKAAQAMLELV